MNQVKAFVKERKYVINESTLKLLKTLELSVLELLFIIYFDNSETKEFNITSLVNYLGFTETEVMNTLDSLMKKKLISLDAGKDHYNKSIEIINLDGLYNIIEDLYNQNINEQKKENIYDTFSHELGHKLTKMDYEIINGWLNNNYSEELILGALKEAVFNGVNSFRYIDKILYEWSKKGFKTMNDVKNSLSNREEKNDKELFDYNWLEDTNE